MLLFLTFLAAYSHELLQKIATAQKNLHELTEYKTIYDLLGLTEMATLKSINDAFFIAWRKNRQKGGTKKKNELTNLLNEFYNIMKTDKDAYDYVLNHPFIMNEDKTGTMWKFVAGSIIFLVFMDFLRIFGKVVRRRGGFGDMYTFRIFKALNLITRR